MGILSGVFGKKKSEEQKYTEALDRKESKERALIKSEDPDRRRFEKEQKIQVAQAIANKRKNWLREQTRGKDVVPEYGTRTEERRTRAENLGTLSRDPKEYAGVRTAVEGLAKVGESGVSAGKYVGRQTGKTLEYIEGTQLGKYANVGVHGKNYELTKLTKEMGRKEAERLGRGLTEEEADLLHPKIEKELRRREQAEDVMLGGGLFGYIPGKIHDARKQYETDVEVSRVGKKRASEQKIKEAGKRAEEKEKFENYKKTGGTAEERKERSKRHERISEESAIRKEKLRESDVQRRIRLRDEAEAKKREGGSESEQAYNITKAKTMGRLSARAEFQAMRMGSQQAEQLRYQKQSQQKKWISPNFGTGQVYQPTAAELDPNGIYSLGGMQPQQQTPPKYNLDQMNKLLGYVPPQPKPQYAELPPEQPVREIPQQGRRLLQPIRTQAVQPIQQPQQQLPNIDPGFVQTMLGFGNVRPQQQIQPLKPNVKKNKSVKPYHRKQVNLLNVTNTPNFNNEMFSLGIPKDAPNKMFSLDIKGNEKDMLSLGNRAQIKPLKTIGKKNSKKNGNVKRKPHYNMFTGTWE